MTFEMKHDLDEWITEAIMSETPVVIVEGHDDIQFYNKLAAGLNKNLWVEAVENINGYSEGCEAVVKCIRDLQPKINERSENIKYILGVIDRDSRYYRNQIPNYGGLFILKYYSYESHFVTQTNLSKLITNITYSNHRLMDKKTLDYIESDFYSSACRDLYYMSLEALKNACVHDYETEVSYEEKAGRIFAEDNKNLILQKIEEKENELDAFAIERDITPNDLKYIAKGKWLIHLYSSYILEKIKRLQDVCSSGVICTCNYCINGTTDKCLWKIKMNYQVPHIMNYLLSFIDETEVEYIKDRLNLLT